MRWLVLVLLLLTGCEPSTPALQPLKNLVAEDVTGAKYAQNFELFDHHGQRRTLADFRGKVVAIFFGYTHCPDVCPTTLYDFSQAMKLLGADADKVQVLFVTVDPARDTPEMLSQYVPAFDARFLGMYADANYTAQLARQYQIYYRQQAVDASGNYAIDHSAFTYVYDSEGRLRLKMPFAQTPANIASDLRQLLR
ncbi:MAG: SCO family protein [Sulfuriferula sp.]